MINNVPIGKVERGLEPIGDPVFKLMPEIKFMRVRVAFAAMVKMPGHPILDFKLALVGGCDLVGEREVTFRRRDRCAGTNDET